ncbi:MAG: AmmeMemoRadiSam system protein B, partial [Candidatus Omnitrophica bacterium]|nr:AmmeMemoRadiSam system protein B [Candidatus Omnitrophota bacterium]
TPFGRLSIDEPLGKLLLEKAVHIKADLIAHQFEHSIEVELPILYHFLGNFQFVPIACQVSTLAIYRSVALEIYEAIKGFKEDVLLIASSDMTHYEPEQAARRKDRSAMEAIVSLDEEDLVKRVRKDDITMCGVAPVAILLSCVKLLGAKKAQVAMYQTSGDASGDYSSVVGYAGIIVS